MNGGKIATLPVPDMRPATLHSQASPVTHSKLKKLDPIPTGQARRKRKSTKHRRADHSKESQTQSKEAKEEINKSLTKLK